MAGRDTPRAHYVHAAEHAYGRCPGRRWLLLLLVLALMRGPPGAGAERERFSREVFDRLKWTLHTLPTAEADRAVRDFLPAAREPLPGSLPGSPVEHLVVLFIHGEPRV